MSLPEVEYVAHRGIITGIDKDRHTLRVALSDADDCGGCPAAKICGAASGKNTIEVNVTDTSRYHIGDRITVKGTERIHRKAIMLATVIPSLILIVIMTGVYMATGNQLTACLSAIGAMIIFFYILYRLRNKLRHEFRFEPGGDELYDL